MKDKKKKKIKYRFNFILQENGMAFLQTPAGTHEVHTANKRMLIVTVFGVFELHCMSIFKRVYRNAIYCSLIPEIRCFNRVIYVCVRRGDIFQCVHFLQYYVTINSTFFHDFFNLLLFLFLLFISTFLSILYIMDNAFLAVPLYNIIVPLLI